MRRELAIRYARQVADRVHSVNGLLATPNCIRDAVRISRIWVFGSTVKGSDFPNDLDLLIEAREVGRTTGWKRGRKLDKYQLRTHGCRLMPHGEREMLIWLTRGMKKVSRHMTYMETVETIDVKRLIYPRWEIQ